MYAHTLPPLPAGRVVTRSAAGRVAPARPADERVDAREVAGADAPAGVDLSAPADAPAVPLTEADALAARASAGDAAALTTLVARYHPRCLRFARNMGLGREDAEEAVQDAFVRMAGALPRFRPGAAFEPWLFRILANRCRSARVRARGWNARHADAAALDGVPAPGRDALAAADAEHRRRAVLAALDELPAEQREAFLLRHVEDLDYAAMARVTGAGQSALKMRVKRACDALRARLGASGGVVAGGGGGR